METNNEVQLTTNPVSKEDLIREIKPDKPDFFLKESRGFIMYVINAIDCPLTMNEIGRLREITFRDKKAGTGKSLDIDEFDKYFEQLIIWDKKNQEIVGGYRIQTMSKLWDYAKNKESFSPLATYFNLSARFMKKYFPYTAEFGRAFVQPAYQNTSAFEALLNGLGYWIHKKNSGTISWKNPVTFLVGKITLYPKFGDLDPIYHFIDKYFPAKDPFLISPKDEYRRDRPYEGLHESVKFSGIFKDDFKDLVRRFKASILIGFYGRLSCDMQCFGTIFNEKFGETEETSMMIKVPNIYIEFLKRYHIIK